MADKEFNIKSSTIEKGLELAKDFLGKLISPTIEEVGLLVSENIKFLRFKNQIRILLKAKTYVENKKINLKEIPLKILVPLLENASLEENETLQDKWAKMLTNMVDSESNLQNQIFPYILSQISIEEFNELKELLYKEKDFKGFQIEYEKIRIEDKSLFSTIFGKYQKKIDEVEQDGFRLDLLEFEIANMLRLGLIRQLPPKIYIPEFKTGGRDKSDEQWHTLDAAYFPHEYGFRITELGEKFIKICELDQSQASR